MSILMPRLVAAAIEAALVAVLIVTAIVIPMAAGVNSGHMALAIMVGHP